jgi:hypothetical protein
LEVLFKNIIINKTNLQVYKGKIIQNKKIEKSQKKVVLLKSKETLKTKKAQNKVSLKININY